MNYKLGDKGVTQQDVGWVIVAVIEGQPYPYIVELETGGWIAADDETLDRWNSATIDEGE